MIIEIEGIVIKQVQYKEKDAMVSVLTKDGTVSFLARGILSPTSKNAASCLLFAYSSFTLSSRQDKLTLTQGKLIKSSYLMFDSLEKMAAMQLISEVLIKCLDEENGVLYPYFYNLLRLLGENYDSLTLVAICLAQIINNSGYALEYNSCINCGAKRNIVSFSYKEGGFICQKCANDIKELSSSILLKSYRYVFKVSPELMDHYTLKKDIAIKLIDEFSSYLLSSFDLKEFKALDIYKNSL
ncbi:MAG: DNA repair protein RecO [Bacillales bacterium]|nr:DNA repair protein RecO [Bacillales bacterium]